MTLETIVVVLAVIGWIDLAGGAIVAILAGLFGISDGSIPRE